MIRVRNDRSMFLLINNRLRERIPAHLERCLRILPSEGRNTPQLAAVGGFAGIEGGGGGEGAEEGGGRAECAWGRPREERGREAEGHGVVGEDLMGAKIVKWVWWPRLGFDRLGRRRIGGV